jgi:hypothetical protein
MIQVEQNKFALQFFSFLNKKNSRAVLFPGLNKKNSRAVLFPGCEEGGGVHPHHRVAVPSGSAGDGQKAF